MVDDDSRAKKQEMSHLGATSDLISNLPDNVIDRILVRLPIRDAVRTSVLSTNWRYTWTTITQLVIHDNQLILHNNNNNNNTKYKIINFIDRVLLLHSGFIQKFDLSIKCFPMISFSSMIDAWILFLSRKNIKEIVLKFSDWPGGRRRYKLPSCFFSAQQICTLELGWCVLKLPTTFTGFSNLKSLYLYETTFVDKVGFECLISKCPLLERLILVKTDGIHHLNICSPNLKYLFLHGIFQDICFENTPLLLAARICLMGYKITDQTVEKFLQTETRNVVKVLSSLPRLKKFEVNGSFLKFLSVSKIPEKLPFTCHHLNHLILKLNFECVNHMCVTLCLLKSAPNLRKLHIDSYNPLNNPSDNIENFWEEQTHIDWKMSRLQVVKIKNFNGFEFNSGLEFTKLLLANSPKLEMLSIIPYPNIPETLESMEPGKKDMLLLQLRRFKRASPKAVIKFSDLQQGVSKVCLKKGVFTFCSSQEWVERLQF